MEVDGWTVFSEEEQDAIGATDVLASPTASQPKKRRKYQQPELSTLERSQKRQRVDPVSQVSASSSKLVKLVGLAPATALEQDVYSPLQPLANPTLPLKPSQSRSSFSISSPHKAARPSVVASIENPPRAGSVVNISSEDEPAGDPQHTTDTDTSTEVAHHERLMDYLGGKRKGKQKKNQDERKIGPSASNSTRSDSSASDFRPLNARILIDLTLDEPETWPTSHEVAPKDSMDNSMNKKSASQNPPEIIEISDDDDFIPVLNPSVSTVSISEASSYNKKVSLSQSMGNTSATRSPIISENATATPPPKDPVEPSGHVLDKLPTHSSVTITTPVTRKPLASGPGETESVFLTKNISGSTHESPPPPSIFTPPSQWGVTPSRSPTIPSPMSSPVSLRRGSALPRIPQDYSSPVHATVSSPTPQLSPSRRGSSPANDIVKSLAGVSITSEGGLPNPSPNLPGSLDSPSGAFPQSGLSPQTHVHHSSTSSTSCAANEIIEDIPSNYEGPNEDISSTWISVSGGSGSSAKINMQASISFNISSTQTLSIPNSSRSSPALDMSGSDISDALFADLLRNIEEEEFGYTKSMVSTPSISEQAIPPITPVTPSTKRALPPPASTSPVPKMDTVIPEPVLTPVKRLSSLVNTPGSPHTGQWARKSTGTRAGPPSPMPMSGRRAHKTTHRGLTRGVTSLSPQRMDTLPSSTAIAVGSSKALVEARRTRPRSPGAIVGINVSKLPPGHDAKLEEHLMLAAHAQRFLTYENRSWYELSPRLQRDPAMAEVYEAMIRRCTPKEPHAPRIGIVNLIDPDEQRCPPWEFLWTNEVIYGVGVPPTNKNDLHGCDCDGPCDPKSKTCTCIQRQRKMVPELAENGQAFCYNPDGTLKDYLQKTVIIECNSDCLCDDNCVNRTIQQGRKIKINLEKTEKKGWGVFAKQNIKAGTFVGIYAGELVKEEEAERRGMLYGVLGRTYMFDIDFGHLSEFSVETGSVPALSARSSRSSIGMDGDTGPKTPVTTSEPTDREILYAVDAFHVGNHTRFLVSAPHNHSCEPNCYIVAAYIEEPDIERPFLAIFTSDDVKAGNELTFDYAGGVEPKKDESEGEKLAVYAKCECGARSCRGYMFT